MEYEMQEEPVSSEEVVSSGNLMDSPTSHLDDALNQKLEDAFDRPTEQFRLHDIAKIACEYDPIDLAYAVTRLPAPERVIVYENLPDLDAKIIFITNTGNNTRSVIFAQIEDQEIRSLLEKMPPDEAVWLLDDMSDRTFRRVMEIIDPKKAASIRELYQHDRHSAGRLMTNEFFAFNLNTTIAEVSAAIRENPGIDLTRYLFVLNDLDALVGYVPLRNLIINRPYVPIKQVMRPVLHQIRADASRDEVVDLVERYKIPSLPVVDESDRLMGVITYASVVEAMEDIADETIANIAGTREDLSEHEPIFKRFLWRAPWLFVTLCAGLVTSGILSYFKDKNWFTFVALFVPLVGGMSGNVGIQCSTILVRGMSTGELSSGTRRKAVFSELSIGLLIGVIFGLLCGIFVYILNHFDIHYLGSNPLALGIIVSTGLLGACLMATLLGTLSPFFFARFRIDPAVASGPIVTAFNDVLSTLMYILIAKAITSFFW
jgi:magnesium transporter